MQALAVGDTNHEYTLKLPPKYGTERPHDLLATSLGADGDKKIHDIRPLLSESFGAFVHELFGVLLYGLSVRHFVRWHCGCLQVKELLAPRRGESRNYERHGERTTA